MVAGPMPLVGVSVSHGAIVVALQEQPFSPESEKLPLCPSAETFADVGLIAKLHAGPVCVIVMLCPPTVIMPERIGVPVSAATVKPALPSPVPCWPKTITIQLTEETTFLIQELALAWIVSVPVPPACGKDCGVAVSVNEQV